MTYIERGQEDKDTSMMSIIVFAIGWNVHTVYKMELKVWHVCGLLIRVQICLSGRGKYAHLTYNPPLQKSA